MSIFCSISLELLTCTFVERVQRGVPTLSDQKNVLTLNCQHIKLDQVIQAHFYCQTLPLKEWGPPSFDHSNAWAVLLEVLNRVPTTEVLRPFAMDLLKLCMHILQTDDEVSLPVSFPVYCPRLFHTLNRFGCAGQCRHRTPYYP